MASNKITEYHQQWIGYLNPTGLVFSPHALDAAQAVINEGVVSEQKEFQSFVTQKIDDEIHFIGFAKIHDLFINVLNWRESDLDSDPNLITQHSFSHPQFNEVVSPTYVAKVNDDNVILIQELGLDDFDSTNSSEDNWNSSPHFKFERLLREKQVSTGIIVSKEKLRLVFAPRGESSGYVDFPFKIMYQPSGRLVFSAFRELLSDAKVFNSPQGQSLIEILELSRKYQAQVSIELSGQVLAALYELLRGFQTANDDDSGQLLAKTLEENPQLIYEGLLTILLRMVFIMYAEDRDLLATDEVYQSSYSLAGLYERLRQDEAQNPDTMDSRYGAWAHLISLFRLIYDGAEYHSEKGKVILPARHGHLFDPDIYLFLEGRQEKDQIYRKAPNISDGVIFRVLKNLLLLNGERISYRTLDVEQIGSVYETMMGFELGIAEGETIALKPAKSHGAPIPVNLSEILKVKDKAKKLKDDSDTKLTDRLKKEFNACKTIEDLERVLEKRIDVRATPFRLSKGAMVLAPSEARRKSGSHYTPRELTEPIVRVALEPIFKNLGDLPTPEQILDLKICDPAMGSGAFLVEVCRQLSERLVESWTSHKVKIEISADEDELLHARKLIAQKCLYGVDKNHMAVNLAKLSLWLVTLAKDHSFSFLDHNLKHGDSLVGLTNKQIMAFSYSDKEELPLYHYMKDKLSEALDAREEIINASEENNYDALKTMEAEYLERLEPLRLVGDLVLKCFFDGKNEKERTNNLGEHEVVINNFFASNNFEQLRGYCQEVLKRGDSRFVPFHWELEFPEVFKIENSGFDCFVGNPPFAGKNSMSNSLGEIYISWLKTSYKESHGNSDLVAYFFRKAISLLNQNGVLALVSTNTISQGDTRATSLSYLLKMNCQIYSARKRIKWPGVANVVVSIVHICKRIIYDYSYLDGVKVGRISSFLIPGDQDNDPFVLASNKNQCFQGNVILGDGFVFQESKTGKDCNSLSDLDCVKSNNPEELSAIRPYVGGADITSKPCITEDRFVMGFGDSDELSVQNSFPSLYKLIKEKVFPVRQKLKNNADGRRRKKYWWKWGRYSSGLQGKLDTIDSVIVCPKTSTLTPFTFYPSYFTFDQTCIVFTNNSFSEFALLQSTIHHIWYILTGSTMKDDPVYTSSSCYETFPFPENYLADKKLHSHAMEYFEYRKMLMLKMNVGLTKIYNRFHDPDESNSEILKLRKLHRSIDQAVLDTYGWNDIALKYDFILDYEEEDEGETSSSKKKKPYRYKFVPELHDEILARLLKLNKKKYDDEVRLGLHKR